MKKINNTTKIIINYTFCHILLIYGFIYGGWWMFPLSFLWWYIIAIIAISAGYHRFYAHKSFKSNKIYEWVINVLSLFSGAGPVMLWACIHRQHHAYSDTEKDPHSPEHKGFFKTYTNLYGYNIIIERKFIKDLLRNKIVRLFNKFYFKLVLTIIVILSLIDPLLTVFIYAFPCVLAFHGYGLLNTLGHLRKEPRNSFISNILTAGEGWHKNHHDNPKLYYNKYDITGRFIKLIKEEE